MQSGAEKLLQDVRWLPIPFRLEFSSPQPPCLPLWPHSSRVPLCIWGRCLLGGALPRIPARPAVPSAGLCPTPPLRRRPSGCCDEQLRPALPHLWRSPRCPLASDLMSSVYLLSRALPLRPGAELDAFRLRNQRCHSAWRAGDSRRLNLWWDRSLTECPGEAFLDKGMTLDCVSRAFCNFQPHQVRWFYSVGCGFFCFVLLFAFAVWGWILVKLYMKQARALCSYLLINAFLSPYFLLVFDF